MKLVLGGQFLLSALFLLRPSPAAAQVQENAALQTKEVAPGVVYRFYERAGPRRVFTVDVDLGKADPELVLAGDDLPGAARLSAIVTQAKEKKAFAAVNADYFEKNGTPVGLTLVSGEIAATSTRPLWDAFFLGPKGEVLLDRAGAAPEAMIPGDGKPVPLLLNRPLEGNDDIGLFTARFGKTTKTPKETVEAALASDAFPLEDDETIKATVTEAANAGNAAIPPKGAVLAGRGKSAERLSALKTGDIVTLQFDQKGIARARWGVGGGPALVTHGKALTVAEMEQRRMKKGFPQALNPRTAIGWSKGKLYLVVVDGRSKESVGINCPELAEFMLTLGCTEALNLDGGGSTEMWVDGEGIVNTSSDKDKQGKSVERPVGEAILIFGR